MVNKYWDLDKDYNIDKILYLMIDRPNEIKYDDLIWLNDKNEVHRDYDLPSWIYLYNKKTNIHWHINDKRHREKSKPAYISHNSFKKYYIDDIFIKEELLKDELSLFE